jgi:hypothetical protein
MAVLPTVDSIDVNRLWYIGVPFAIWWIASMTCVIVRLQDRNYDLSLAGIRAHVAKIEVETYIIVLQKKLKLSSAAVNGDEDRALIDLRALCVEWVGTFFNRIVNWLRYVRSHESAVYAPEEKKRTSLLFGEMYLQVQPLFILFVWGLVVICTVNGGLLFGLSLWMIGIPLSFILWMMFVMREYGWNYEVTVS